jgi:hypothetical protein
MTRRFVREALLPCLALLVAVGLACRSGEGAGEVDPTAFQQQTLAVLREQYPQQTFAADPDVELIRTGENGESTLGLQNLRRRWAESDRSRERLVALVREIFDGHLAAAGSGLLDADWPAVRERIWPQLLPEEYTARAPIAHRPFGHGLILGFVIDLPTSYASVDPAKLATWGVTLDQLEAAALAHLDAVVVETEPVEAVDGVLTVSNRDSYRAVRLLSPAFRTQMAKRLGSPFRAAIPNRDRLLVWPASLAPEAQKRIQEGLRRDLAAQPYPLTETIFEVTADEVKAVD